MRGKLDRVIGVAAEVGITPAHAGKTLCSRPLTAGNTDHPRACGENFHPLRSELTTLGSPPRMRGKPHYKR